MKKILNISLMMFVILFQLKSFAEEKNYHKELITDWSRIFPDKNRNAAGPKFFKYIIDKENTYKDFIEYNKLFCAVSGSLNTLSAMKEIGEIEINQRKIFITFKCEVANDV